MPEPIVALEDSGTATIIRRDVPEPVSYRGRNFIELDFSTPNVSEHDLFQDAAFEVPAGPSGAGASVGDIDLPQLTSEVSASLRSGYLNRRLFSGVSASPSVLRSLSSSAASPSAPPAAEPIASALKDNRRLRLVKLLNGKLSMRFTEPPPPEPRPRIYLVETVGLSTFLGDYGAGRVVKTFSLLPGEVSKISVRSFRRSEALRKASSSILDSVTDESAEDFQTTLESEQSDKEAYAKTFEYHAEAEAKASWGFGSAKVSGGVKGTTNAAREEFSKNVARSTEQHSAKASAKREVEINTSTETTDTSEEERSIEREVKNINVSRTLNFIFRQMNQEFFSLIHLIDVRVAFFNGHQGSKIEVPLYEIDSLLERVVKPGHRQTVAKAIRDGLQAIVNHRGQVETGFVKERSIPDSQAFLRVDTDFVSTYSDPISGREFRVPGVILGTTRNVMRTEGVIVESLLGQASALDGYAQNLQQVEVEQRKANAAMLAADVRRKELGNQLVDANEGAKVELLAKLCSCHDEPDADAEPDA